MIALLLYGMWCGVWNFVDVKFHRFCKNYFLCENVTTTPVVPAIYSS